MSEENDKLVEVIEGATARSTRAIIDSIHANASADALKSLGSLEAEVGHLKNSADKVESALATQGETLNDHGRALTP